MKLSASQKRKVWFWVGVVLLSISVLSLIFFFANYRIGAAIFLWVVFTAIPIGIGIYGVIHGRKGKGLKDTAGITQMWDGFGKINIYFEAFLSLVYFCLLPMMVLVFSHSTTPKERFNMLRDLFSKRTKAMGRVTSKKAVVTEQPSPGGGYAKHTRYYITVEQLEFRVTKRVYDWIWDSDEVVVDHWPHSKCVARVELLSSRQVYDDF